jgi:calcineurin-like phosphoesterase family protein
MSDIWVISDTHFNHENIIGYGQRPFYNVTDMNETMIERWNSVVKDTDKIYHLGDVYMSDGDRMNSILHRLKGKKRLILGNHDNGRDQILQKHFKKIDVWRDFRDFGLLLTHVPVHQSALRRGFKRGKEESLVNIHGHIHQNKSPDGPYRCVCVEHTDYFPINIEELRVK